MAPTAGISDVAGGDDSTASRADNQRRRMPGEGFTRRYREGGSRAGRPARVSPGTNGGRRRSNGRRRRGAVWDGGAAQLGGIGSRTRNVVPWPTSLSTRISPPS